MSLPGRLTVQHVINAHYQEQQSVVYVEKTYTIPELEALMNESEKAEYERRRGIQGKASKGQRLDSQRDQERTRDSGKQRRDSREERT